MIVGPTDLDRARLGAAVSAVKDSRDYAGVVVKKPWGHEFQVFASEQFSLWKLCLLPNSETSMHCHVGKDTILSVNEGVVTVSTLDRTFVLRSGGMLVIRAGAFHRTSTGLVGAVVMEVEAPPNKSDLVRLEDKYGRAGTGYECA